jgi:hypothetical protein
MPSPTLGFARTLRLTVVLTLVPTAIGEIVGACVVADRADDCAETLPTASNSKTE